MCYRNTFSLDPTMLKQKSIAVVVLWNWQKMIFFATHRLANGNYSCICWFRVQTVKEMPSRLCIYMLNWWILIEIHPSASLWQTSTGRHFGRSGIRWGRSRLGDVSWFWCEAVKTGIRASWTLLVLPSQKLRGRLERRWEGKTRTWFNM